MTDPPESPASKAQAEHYGTAPVSDTLPWTPYTPLKRKHDEVHQSGRNQTSQGFIHDASKRGIVQAGYQVPTYPKTQDESPALPYMPGATRYLQERESRAARSPSVIGSSTNDLIGHAPGFRSRQQADQHHDTARFATAQPPRQIYVAPESALNTMDNGLPEVRQRRSSRPMPTSNPPRGTQSAPLEISSSPEPETDHTKTAKALKTAYSEPRGVSKPTGSMNVDGSYRQEIVKTLAEYTDIKPSKVRYYAVAIGRIPGVYLDWPSAEKQIHGFHGAKHKKFKGEEDALDYIEKYREYTDVVPATPAPRLRAQRSGESTYSPNNEVYESHQPSVQQYKMLDPDPLDFRQDFVPLSEGHIPVFDDGPKLVPEQQHVVDLILQGHNVFYTGSAGCGKSTILKSFVRQLKNRGRRVKIVAPTNLAALNVGGQTTWNFAGWTPDSMKIHIEKLKKNSLGKESWKKFDETDVLVIDEISMIENLQFQRLNEILKYSRGEKHGGRAFGGIQLIVTGDVSVYRCRLALRG